VLHRLGITLFEAGEAGCCGSMSQHMAQPEEARAFMKRNIDAWWPHIEEGVEAIVITASGCGPIVKDYGELLQHDVAYAAKARRVSELACDLSEVMQQQPVESLQIDAAAISVAFHSPCTLQHGQQLDGVVERILGRAGFKLVPVSDAHLCCGSAGTYSILQPVIAQQLLTNKLAALQHNAPDIIATANIGCQLHLATRAGVAVKHWIELLDEAVVD
jgi:glycolate oxidase iron-sulfur subunit